RSTLARRAWRAGPRWPLHRTDAPTEAISRSRWPWSSLAVDHGAGAAPLVAGVEVGAAVEVVVAGLAENPIPVSQSPQFVGVRTATDHVAAAPAVVARDVVASGSSLEDVLVRIVHVAGAVDPVVAPAADRSLPADHTVSAPPADQHVTELAAAPVEEVSAGTSDDLVAAVVAVELVGSVPAIEEVVAPAGVDRVVAALTADVVDPVAGGDGVVAPARDDHIAARGALDGVVSGAANDRRRAAEAGLGPGGGLAAPPDGEHRVERRRAHHGATRRLASLWRYAPHRRQPAEFHGQARSVPVPGP